MRNRNSILYDRKFPPLVYGLDGIRSLFNISTSSATKYRRGLLKGACAQQGKVIVVNTFRALQLFGIRQAKSLVSSEKFPPVVYGLNGICSLFNVSITTAWRYSNGLLKDACTQNEKIIIVDTLKAFTLFGVPDAASLIKKKK